MVITATSRVPYPLARSSLCYSHNIYYRPQHDKIMENPVHMQIRFISPKIESEWDESTKNPGF